MSRIFALVITIFLTVVLSGSAYAQSANITAVAGSTVLVKGDTFDVDVKMNLEEAATAARIYINFDPTKISGQSIDTGVSAFTTVWPEAIYDNASGVVKLQAGQKAPGVSGEITFARLTFAANESGSANLSLDASSLVLTPNDSNLVNEFNDLVSFTINEPAAGEPQDSGNNGNDSGGGGDSQPSGDSGSGGTGGSDGRCSKPGDVDCNGRVDISDLSRLLANWRKAYVAADFDNNGRVDISDLSRMLSNWKK